MIPLIVENFCLSFISLIRFFMENFKERKLLYLCMFLINFMNLTFVVSWLCDLVVPPLQMPGYEAKADIPSLEQHICYHNHHGSEIQAQEQVQADRPQGKRTT